MFKKILIANRGEIAIRIIQAASELGIKTVSIYHEVDKEMPFVKYADESIELIADTPKAGYLDINQIIKIAIATNSEAIHPGYGFLSENAVFSDACKNNNIKFIGPDAHSIKVMGNKTAARELMQEANVPIVPGTNEKISNFDEAKIIANKIGYPILLKAAAGGGGKGMRLVEKEEDFVSSYEAAQREAIKAFGDDVVYMEKFIINPKHIEIQVLADQDGNCIFLGERDCSIQRRHQKVIEEAPSTVLDEELRNRMGEVAVNAAKACNYEGAGTIEFLLDINKNFYFLEMNTRLQVEHPVTELITGVDLAKEQIKIAYGKKLSLKQEEVKIQGHAIECRIYAEDPQSNFMPDIGKITYLQNPSGNGIRVDSGIEQGGEVSIHFDPMLSKLITYAETREAAIDKMIMALKSYKILGFKTVIPFLIAVMQEDTFRNKYFDTGYIEKHFDFKTIQDMKDEDEELIAILTAYDYKQNHNKRITKKSTPKVNNWKLNNLRQRRLV